MNGHSAEAVGTVYLLHFDRPYRHAQHYLGWALDEMDRVNQHLSGKGNPLVKAAINAGCHVELVRVWRDATRLKEQELKSRRNARALCPVCKDAKRARKTELQRERRRRK